MDHSDKKNTSAITARILIIRSGNIGDTIWASALMDALVDIYGNDIQIDWVAKNFAFDLFKNDPRVKTILPLNHRKIPIFLSNEKRAIIKHSHKYPYDLLINAEAATYFQSLVKKISALHKIDALQFIKNKTKKKPKPAVEFYIELLKYGLNISNKTPYYPKLYPSHQIPKEITLKKPYICLTPATSNSAKKRDDNRIWPINYWRELILMLEKKYTLVILGGPQDNTYIKRLGNLPKTVITLVGKTSINESLNIIQNAKQLIAADTGTIHMAAALETPVIGIYGPSKPEVTGPYVKDPKMAMIFSCYLDNQYGPYLPNTPADEAIKTIKPEMIAKAILD